MASGLGYGGWQRAEPVRADAHNQELNQFTRSIRLTSNIVYLTTIHADLLGAMDALLGPRARHEHLLDHG